MHNTNLRIFGARLRELRKQKGLSQESLAELSGVHRNFIGFIERGERNVGIRTVIKLAFALEMMTADLFAGCEFEDEVGDTDHSAEHER